MINVLQPRRNTANMVNATTSTDLMLFTVCLVKQAARDRTRSDLVTRYYT